MDASPPQLFDVAVIGGGINGVGIARDLAGRGARVVLFERDDLASGTSSASTKLIHGGLRYLEHYEFALVREALSERERLWGIAPHIIWPMRFVLPLAPGMRPAWLLRAGLFLYDHIGGRKRLPATQAIALQRHPAGAPLRSDLRRAFVYSDCWVDDARLVALNARDAAERGATILTRTPVEAFARNGETWRLTTPGGEFRARVVVNAAGPAVLDVLASGPDAGEHRVRKVRGSHIVVPRLFAHDDAYFFQNPDGRIFFAIPYEQHFTLIGTTDVDHAPRDSIAASAAEVQYLCDATNRYFTSRIAPDDVMWSFAGVRPLLEDGSNRPEAATRGYRLDISPPEAGATLLTIFGGKITTYRHLAESACERLAERLPQLSRQSWTASQALPGGDFSVSRATLAEHMLRDFPFLEPTTAARFARSYGTEAWRLLAGAQSRAGLGRAFGGKLTEAEGEFLRTHEFARQADDILWRRSKLGLHMTAEEREGFRRFWDVERLAG